MINTIGYRVSKINKENVSAHEYWYYCTFDNAPTWGLSSRGNSIAKNCAVFNTGNDFDGFNTIDYCASDDGDGDHPEDFTAEETDWNKVFEDYSTGDFSLKNYTTNPCCMEEGTSLAASQGIWRDITGTERDASAPDIGAFEYVGGAPPPTFCVPIFSTDGIHSLIFGGQIVK